MTHAQHTPGPWAIRHDLNGKDYVVGDRYVAEILDWQIPTNPDEPQANARLIAAAPNLFRALDDLATWTHALAVHGHAPPSAWKLLDKLHAQADAALNKAQGLEP